MLEQSEGFQDRAVVGGLEQFVKQVRITALPTLDGPERDQLTEVLEPLDGYSSSSPRDRKEMLEVALSRIARLGSAIEGRGTRNGGATPVRRAATPPPGSPGPARGDVDPAQAQLPGASPALVKPKPAAASPRPVLKKASPLSVSVADMDMPVERIPGVGAALLPRLRKLGVLNARDLLYMFPVRHMDRSSFKPIGDLQPGQDETVMGTIWEIRNERTRRGMTKTTLLLSDKSGSISATWFNQPYLVRNLHQHAEVVLSGKVELFMGRLQLSLARLGTGNRERPAAYRPHCAGVSAD